MRMIDRDGKRLCDIQAELFEQSVYSLDMSSEVFVRRFMNSNVAKQLDNLSFLYDTKTISDIYLELDEQYGKSNYGSIKYHRDAMYWTGYLYRYFVYTYEITSKQAYKILPLKEVISTFEPYHTLDVSEAIYRLLEAKKMTFDEDKLEDRYLSIMRHVRAANKLKLVKLTKEYKTQLFEMMDEWVNHKGDKNDKTPHAIFKNDYHDFDNYLNNLEIKDDDGKHVPDSTFFALDIKRNIFVGAVNIRHYLNDKLLKDGGHIGDGIRPSERRKGFGTEMIRLTLLECKKLGINNVLMVCDKDNIASRKTIINNGGKKEEQDFADDTKIERYWIKI